MQLFHHPVARLPTVALPALCHETYLGGSAAAAYTRGPAAATHTFKAHAWEELQQGLGGAAIPLQPAAQALVMELVLRTLGSKSSEGDFVGASH
jgi:hypothetical protein